MKSLDGFAVGTVEHLLGEVKTGRRSGDAVLIGGEDGLVLLGVLEGSGDVRRQRHLPCAVEHFFENPVVEQFHTLSAFRAGIAQNANRKLLVHLVTAPGGGSPRRFAEALPLRIADPLEQQKLHRAARILTLAKQPCGQNPRVVSNQHVLWRQKLRNLGKDAVLNGAVLSIVNQQARTRAVRYRRLRNEFLGQVVIKIARVHLLCFLALIRVVTADFTPDTATNVL